MSHIRILVGDCIERMRGLEHESIDAIDCDPPYGIEFMGKEWDSFRTDDSASYRHRGERAGAQGSVRDRNGTNPAAGRVEYGGGKRPTTSRCTGCGKRDQFRNEHGCDGARWARELIDPFAAPPTSLAFSNWCRTWALEALRILKPGGHLLAFGGTRLYHRLAAGIEDAGFEIRDSLHWIYGSGFPKNHDIAKAIDKAAGVERPRVEGPSREQPSNALHASGYGAPGWKPQTDEPQTDAARQWYGWGTALKPAHEPIVVARKPMPGTIADSVLEHGTGALNVDGCRLDPMAADDPSRRGLGHGFTSPGDETGSVFGVGPRTEYDDSRGRWPPNILLAHSATCEPDGVCRDDCPVGIIDQQGGAGRFFPAFRYVPKPGVAERNIGLLDMPLESQAKLAASVASDDVATRNVHPTVKPIEMMAWLCRLVTPPGGTVLDPFLGSGTTAIAAAREGFACIGIEREPEYVDIAVRRIRGDLPMFTTVEVSP